MRKTVLKESTRNNINGFLFALPWILGFLIFSVYPLFTSLYYSFADFSPIKPAEWVGLENFKLTFKDPLFYKSLKNTMFYAFISTPLNLCVALVLALMIKEKFAGRGIVRTVFFLPSIIPMVAATMIWIWMFDPKYGFINNTLGILGIDGPSWLIDPRYTKWALVIMSAWCTGTTMLICLAALQDVPESFYESADMDGANSFVKFFKITLPTIAHVIVYQAILNLINSFQYFTQVYVITTASGGVTSQASGGPANSILMYPLYVFHNAFIYMDMGRASAMAWILFLFVSALTYVMIKLSKKTTMDGAGGE